MGKTKPIPIPVHLKQKIKWKIFLGRRRMNITPWVEIKPDLKYFKK